MLEQVLNFQFWKIARETKPRKTSNRTAMGASSYGKLKMHFWIGSSAVVIVIVENPSADLGNANTEQKGLLAFFHGWAFLALAIWRGGNSWKRNGWRSGEVLASFCDSITVLIEG